MNELLFLNVLSANYKAKKKAQVLGADLQECAASP